MKTSLAGGCITGIERESPHTDSHSCTRSRTLRFLKWDVLHTQRSARLFGGSQLPPMRARPGGSCRSLSLLGDAGCAHGVRTVQGPAAWLREPLGCRGPGPTQGVTLSPGPRGAGPCPASLLWKTCVSEPTFHSLEQIKTVGPQRVRAQWRRFLRRGRQLDGRLCAQLLKHDHGGLPARGSGPAPPPAATVHSTMCVEGGAVSVAENDNGISQPDVFRRVIYKSNLCDIF